MSPALLPRLELGFLQKACLCTVVLRLADMFQNDHNSSMLSFVTLTWPRNKIFVVIVTTDRGQIIARLEEDEARGQVRKGDTFQNRM